MNEITISQPVVKHKRQLSEAQKAALKKGRDKLAEKRRVALSSVEEIREVDMRIEEQAEQAEQAVETIQSTENTLEGIFDSDSEFENSPITLCIDGFISMTIVLLSIWILTFLT